MDILFKHEAGKYYQIGAARKKPLSDDQMVQIILDSDENISKAQAKIDLVELKRIAKNIKTSSDDEVDEIRDLEKQLLDKYRPFENFFVAKFGNDDRSQLVYYRKSNQEIHLLCPLPAFCIEVVDNHLIKTRKKMLIDFRDEWAEIHANDKRPKNYDYSMVLNEAWNIIDPKSRLPEYRFSGTPHPVVLEDSGSQGECVISYSRSDVTFNQLHESLQNLLARIEHHEYLCAILWSFFSGNQLPYVIYIQGSGGSGKSVFMNFLGEIVSKSVGNYDVGAFVNSSLIGKALILLPENNTVSVMQHKELKSITGGDSVKIEVKGLTAYSAQIRGLFVISSNYHLECEGTDDEKRRLRYFQLNKDPQQRRIHPDAVVNEFLTSKNEFLNYCRQCFETLEIPNSCGLIEDAPNHSEIFSSMLSAEREKLFHKFFTSYVLKNYELSENCRCASEDILEQFRKLPQVKDNKTLPRKFKTWMTNNYKIEDKGLFLQGIKLKTQSDLDDAMPSE